MTRPYAFATLTSLSLAALVLAGTPASAQDSLSRREREYVQALERRFGPVTASRLNFPSRLVAPTPTDELRRPIERPRPERPYIDVLVNGLEVRSDDVAIHRYRFSSPEEAQQMATGLIESPMPEGRQPVVGEVRGNQLLLVTGDIARDPAAAREALDAAWQGLPASPTTDATFAVLGPNELAVHTTLEDGPLRESIDKAIKRARDLQERSDEFQPTPDGGMQVRKPSGFEADLRSDEHGASALLRRSPAGPATGEYLALLDPSSDARSADQVRDANQSASEGARTVVDSLFD